MKKLLSFALALCTLFSMTTAFAMEKGDARAIFGADITEAQKAEVYKTFGIEPGGVTELSETEYSYLGASISLQPLPPRQMGSVHIARTRVVISGESDADDIHRRFFMRFLSAGG